MTDFPPLTPSHIPQAPGPNERLIFKDVRSITMGNGGFIQTAASGERIYLGNTTKNIIVFYSGDDDEYTPALIAEGTSGSGVTRTLQVETYAPMIDVDDQRIGLVVRSGSPDGSTYAPAVVISEVATDGAGTGLDPQFLIQGVQTVTTGEVDISQGSLVLPVKTTTGDPASPSEGQMYVNLFDNAIRVYADSAWRDLVTW